MAKGKSVSCVCVCGKGQVGGTGWQAVGNLFLGQVNQMFPPKVNKKQGRQAGVPPNLRMVRGWGNQRASLHGVICKSGEGW